VLLTLEGLFDNLSRLEHSAVIDRKDVRPRGIDYDG